MNNIRSSELFNRAQKVLPGGVNSPVRAFRQVGMEPPFIKKANGARLYDEDGNEYIDFIGSWGPMILGHAHPDVINDVLTAVNMGSSFGAPTEREVILAEMICEAVTSVEMLRLTSSGTEAAMSAVRLARAYTGRDLVIKFEGCYHGHFDSMLVKAGSGALTHDSPDSAGIPYDFAKHTLTIPFNNEEVLEEVFKKYPESIAAVVMEPVPANMGLVLPKEGYLQFVRNITEKYGAVLVFDEVISGFRLSYNSASGYYGVNPDISIFGKIIGGGFPMGCYGGKREIMSLISPLGKVYQAGTLSGNPVAVAAGIRTLTILKENPDIYNKIEKKAQNLANGFRELSSKYSISTQISQIGSLVGCFFADEEVVDFNSALKSDTKRFAKHFQHMLKNGIYVAPSQFEALFISNSHTDEDIEKALNACEISFKNLF